MSVDDRTTARRWPGGWSDGPRKLAHHSTHVSDVGDLDADSSVHHDGKQRTRFALVSDATLWGAARAAAARRDRRRTRRSSCGTPSSSSSKSAAVRPVAGFPIRVRRDHVYGDELGTGGESRLSRRRLPGADDAGERDHERHCRRQTTSPHVTPSGWRHILSATSERHSPSNLTMLPPGTRLGPTKSCRCWAKAGWARSSGHATRGSTAPSLSRCFRRASRPIRRGDRGGGRVGGDRAARGGDARPYAG